MAPRASQKARRGVNGLGGGPLQRVKQLGTKVLQEGDNANITFSEVDSVIDEIAKWVAKADNDDGNTPGLWAAVDDDGLVRLQAVYALSLRRSSASMTPGLSETMRVAFGSLRSKLSSELYNITYDEGTHTTDRRIAMAVYMVLRAHAMRCHAALLSDASAQLQARPRRSRRALQNAADALTEAWKLLSLLGDVLSTPSNRAAATQPVGLNAIIDASITELAESRLLEHWSRLLLQLSMCEGWGDEARRQLYNMTLQLIGLDSHVKRWPHLYDMMLSSPCLYYMLTSHIVGLCAAVDGGTTYGMTTEPDAAAAAEEANHPPTEQRAVAPTFSASGDRLRRNTPDGASAGLAKWTLARWTTTLTVERSMRDDSIVGYMPPLHMAATLELCLRLAAAGTASVAADAAAAGGPGGAAAATGAATVSTKRGGSGGDGGGGGGSKESNPGLRVAPGEAVDLVMSALKCGRQAVWEAATTFGPVSPRAASRVDRYWEAVAAFLDVAARRVLAAPLDDHGVSIWRELDAVMDMDSRRYWSVQDGPSQGMLAALQRGLVPKLDTLLRAMEERENPLWAELLPIHDFSRARDSWQQMLAFGASGDTALLVSTAARLLRCSAAKVEAAVDGACDHGSAGGGGSGGGQSGGWSGNLRPCLEAINTALAYCSSMFESAVEALQRSVELRDPVGGGQEEQSQQPGRGEGKEEEEEQQQQQPQLDDQAGGLGAVGSGQMTGADDSGLPRLALLVSYMAVHLVPEIRRATVDCYLPKITLPSQLRFRIYLAAWVPTLLKWVALLAAAHGRSVAAAAATAASATIPDPTGPLAETAVAFNGATGASTSGTAADASPAEAATLAQGDATAAATSPGPAAGSSGAATAAAAAFAGSSGDATAAATAATTAAFATPPALGKANAAPTSVWGEMLMSEAGLAKILGIALGVICTSEVYDCMGMGPVLRHTLYVLVKDAPQLLVEAILQPECKVISSLAADGGTYRPDEAVALGASSMQCAHPALWGLTRLLRADGVSPDLSLMLMVFKEVMSVCEELPGVPLPAENLSEVFPPEAERYRAAAALLTAPDQLLTLLPVDLSGGPSLT